MNKQGNISMPVIRRLPKYYRTLSELLQNDITRISSKELSIRLGLTASQIRQDLSCFGGFGQQGYGYKVSQLKQEIGNILGMNFKYKTILLGAGNLGKAVAMYMLSKDRSLSICGIFDKDPNIIGKDINNITVSNIDELENFCNINKPEVAIICVPKSNAAPTFDRLYALGIKNYWNFSNYDFNVMHDDVIVENTHISDSFMTLCYLISNQKN